MPIQPLSAALEMLALDSRVGHSASSAVSYLMDLLYYGDFEIFEQVASGESYERVNLIGVKGDSPEGDPLWLVGTFNTSPEPVPARWACTDGDAHAPTRREGAALIHGLGANSGKLDLVLKILAASHFRADELTRPIYIAALSGEESFGTGVRSLLTTGPHPRGVALVGAPTNLELWTDHPGVIGLRLTLQRRLRHRRMPPSRGFFELDVTGRSAHAQAPGLATDAMSRGLEALDALRAAGDIRLLAFEAGEAANRVAGRCHIKVATSYDDLPELGPGVRGRAIADGTALPFPIGRLFDAWRQAAAAGIRSVRDRLGVARNARAARPQVDAWIGQLATDRNAVTGNVILWTGPGVGTRAVTEQFARAVQTALIGKGEDIEVGIEVVQDRPAFATSEDTQPLLATARAAARDAGLATAVSGGVPTTDAALLNASGIQTLVFGPGRGLGDLYRDDERIPTTHLEAAYRFYVKLVQRWCVTGGD